jgi:hypothetical protein
VKLHPAARLLAEAGPTVSFRETAAVLKCSIGTVYAMNDRGELAAMGLHVLRLGRCLRVTTVSLRRVVGADQQQHGGDAA